MKPRFGRSPLSTMIGFRTRSSRGAELHSQQDYAEGNVLYDPFSQVIRAAGPGYSTAGFRLGVARRVRSSTWASVSYASGRALTSPVLNSALTVSQALYALNARRSQAATAALSGTVNSTGTHWRASYRWQPAATVNSVDLFDNNSQDDFLSILIRQPIVCGQPFAQWHRGVDCGSQFAGRRISSLPHPRRKHVVLRSSGPIHSGRAFV